MTLSESLECFPFEIDNSKCRANFAQSYDQQKIRQRIHISFETKYVRNEVSTEHMFRTTFTFRIARYSFRTKAIHTSFDTKFVSAQFALKFVNAQCVYVNLAGCAD